VVSLGERGPRLQMRSQGLQNSLETSRHRDDYSLGLESMTLSLQHAIVQRSQSMQSSFEMAPHPDGQDLKLQAIILHMEHQRLQIGTQGIHNSSTHAKFLRNGTAAAEALAKVALDLISGTGRSTALRNTTHPSVLRLEWGIRREVLGSRGAPRGPGSTRSPRGPQEP
jgi:hypothetical protein